VYGVAALTVAGSSQTLGMAFATYDDTTVSGAACLWDRAGDTVQVKLWRQSDGALLATATVTTAVGVNTATFGAAVAVAKGTTYWITTRCTSALHNVYVDASTHARLFATWSLNGQWQPIPNGNHWVIAVTGANNADAMPNSFIATQQYPIRPTIP
jgi:hypothetical protein